MSVCVSKQLVTNTCMEREHNQDDEKRIMLTPRDKVYLKNRLVDSNHL